MGISGSHTLSPLAALGVSSTLCGPLWGTRSACTFGATLRSCLLTLWVLEVSVDTLASASGVHAQGLGHSCLRTALGIHMEEGTLGKKV